MKKLALATVLVMTQALALSAYAQEKARPEVKAETASAVKGGAIPKGEAAGAGATAPGTKMTAEEAAAARAKRKSETSTAVKAGEVPKGETGSLTSKSEGKTGEGTTRAKRKADTASAVKGGAIPKGEAGTAK
jgi:hypothetical protein